MDKTTRARIFGNLKNGNYDVSYDYIVDNKPHVIDGDTAIELLGYCIAGLEYSSSWDHLVKFVNLLTFDDLKGEQLVVYIHSEYFILKHLINARKFELILEMETFLAPYFLRNMSSEGQRKNFKNVCALLHNCTVKMMKETKVVDKKMLCDLMQVLTVMWRQVPENYLTKVESYVGSMQYIGCTASEVRAYYMNFLTTIETDERVVPIGFTSYKQLSTILFTVCKGLLAENLFVALQKTILNSKATLLKLTGDKASLLEPIFDVCQLFVPIDQYSVTTRNVTKNVMASMKLAHSDSDLRCHIESFAALIIAVLYTAVNVSAEESALFANPDFILTYYEFTRFLGELVERSTFKCCCAIEYNAQLLIKSLLIPGMITKLGLNHNTAEWLTDASQVLLFECYNECFRIICYIKKKKCKQYTTLWQAVGSNLYNVSTKFYKLKDKSCLRYLTLFINKTFLNEGVCNKIIAENVTKSSLQMYAEICYLSEKYQLCLTVAALNIYLYPEDNSWAFNQWIRCKSTLKDDVQRMLTTTQVLNKNKDTIKTLYPDFQRITDQTVIVNMLIEELAVYKKRWPSRIPIFATFIELFKFADIEIVARELVCTALEDILKIDHTIKTIIYSCIDYLETKREITISEKLTVGCLYFLHYKFAKFELTEANDDEMNSLNVPIKKPSPQEAANADDECDVMSEYTNLRVDNHYKSFVYLKKSLKYLKEYTSLPPDCSFLEEAQVVHYIIEMGHEFKLCCYDLEALHTWTLALEIANRRKNFELIITTSSLVIEHVKAETDMFNELLKNVEESLTKTDDATILCSYYTSLSFAYLKSDKFKSSLDAYEAATEYYYKLEASYDMKIVTAKLKYMLLQCHLSDLPCSFAFPNHDTTMIVRPHFAAVLIMSHVRSTSNLTTSFLSTAFQMTEYILQKFVWMRLPREVRCYGRNIILLAQKLVLPFRTARLLVHLAKADILSVNYDDCDVKLEGLTSILCLSGHRNRKEEMHEVVQIDDEVTELGGRIRDIDLEYPGTAQPKFSSYASPVFYTEPFKLPSFLSHPDNCDCMLCSSVEYQDLVLQKIHLEACLSESRENFPATRDFFKGFFDTYERVKNITTSVPKNVALNCTRFSDTCNSATFDYARYKARNGDVYMAKEINSKLITKLKETNMNYHLYSECNNFQLGLSLDKITVTPQPIPDNNELEIETTNEPKTPTTKMSRIKLVRIVTPQFNSPHMSVLKAVSLNLFGNDPKSPKSKNEERSPSFLVPKTPATKFNIYTPANDKIGKSKKATPSSSTPSYRRKLESDLLGSTKKTVTAKTKRAPRSTKKNQTPSIVVTDENSHEVPKISSTRHTWKKLMDLMSSSSEDDVLANNETEEKSKTKVRRHVKKEGSAGSGGATNEPLRRSARKLLK